MPADASMLTPQMPPGPRLRFAPSPNGLLHLGHAYSALLTNQTARALGGEFCLRIEDIDRDRAKSEHIAAITRDLHWLGLSWPTPPRRQSEHMDDYKHYITRLTGLGLLYPCFASRGEIRRALAAGAAANADARDSSDTDPDGAPLYPAIYKHLPEQQAKKRIAAGEPFALRLHMDKAIALAESLGDGTARTAFSYTQFDPPASGTTAPAAIRAIPINPARWGDVIIARKDIATSYHLAVVVDDHLEGVTHIVRGRDLEAATDIHRLLQIILGFTPPLYHHHELVLIDGEKLSKSRQHPDLFSLRQQGITAAAIIRAAKDGPAALSRFLP